MSDILNTGVTFDDLGLRDDVLAGIKSYGFVHPTDIQAELIPVALRGKDVIGQARTGTGKTAAFTLPILHLADPDIKGQALVLAPTRELAVQITKEMQELAQGTNLQVTSIIGGESMRDQQDSLERGGHLIVGTNPELVSMTGIEGLVSTAGDTQITWNASLTSLAALSDLADVGGDLAIWANDSLASLSGLDAVTSVGGRLSVQDNDAMTSLTGLGGLTTTSGAVEITFNEALTSVAALSALNAVGGQLQISNNPALPSLAGLEALASVGGRVQVSSNSALTSLAGLYGLTSAGDSVSVYSNGCLPSSERTAFEAATQLVVYWSSNGGNVGSSYCP